ncbi:MAG TPA: cytochrome P450 [Acidimicrobiales bacterium]|nr:cytochrome P450 [Acidimicrobiales bacterium]
MTTSVDELDLPQLDLFTLDREEALQRVVEAQEVHWLAKSPVGYLVTRYDDVVGILRDQRFHSGLGVLTQVAGVGDDYLATRRPSILTMEGEEHARLRRLVAPAFTPGSVERLRPFMADVLSGLVDVVAPRGHCELVAEVCDPYPIPIICELLGTPKEDWKLFSAWATDIFRIFNGDLATDLPAIRRASEELEAYMRTMVDERRRQPADDLLSALIAIEEEGDRLDTDELVLLAEAVLMAGTDTTRNQLACCVALFADHPDQWALLAKEPDLAPRAVEESMRYLGTVRASARIASEDIEYRGVCFPKGTLVAVTLAGANRDRRVWDDPGNFDVTVERSTLQLTFGSGIHHCLGAALARAELQTALPLLATRLPNLSLDGPVQWKPPNFGIWGPARLPLRFDPTPAS